MKRSTLLTVTGFAGAFIACIAGIVYLAASGVVTRQMAILLGVALVGFILGFGILIGVYRLIERLD